LKTYLHLFSPTFGGQFAEEEEVLFPPCTLLEVLCKKPQEILDEQEETFKKFDTNG
jgi:hypothetical protein